MSFGYETDGQLLARFAAGGDQAAFDQIVRRHGPMVARICGRLCRTGPDAEDATQEILVKECAPNYVSYINAYPVHPSHSQGDIEFPAKMEYIVPIREAAAGEAVAISVPYRSTLKKFQAEWIGKPADASNSTALPPGIDGAVALSPAVMLAAGAMAPSLWMFGAARGCMANQ